MNVFGIQVTPGHVILMAIGILVYDAVWTWIFPNTASDWWFARLQALLKVGIYTGLIGFVALVVYTPWPVNLILALSAALSITCIMVWLNRRQHH